MFDTYQTKKGALQGFIISLLSYVCGAMMEKSSKNKTTAQLNAQIHAFRKKIEELEREKEELESLIRYASLGVVTVDRKMTITSCNPVFEDLFGYKASEIAGKNLDDVIAKDELRTEAEKYSRETLKGAPIHYTGKRFCKAGTPVEVEFFAVPMKVKDKVVGAYGLYQDISERIVTREKLEESEERLKRVFQASPLGIGLVRGRIMQWHNEAMSKMLGYHAEELIGKDARMLYPDVHEYQRAGESIALLNPGEKTSGLDTRWVRKGGEIFDCHIWYSRLAFGPEGDAVLAIAEDITERKRVERLLRESEERYRQLIEASPLAICVFNTREIFFANPAAMKIMEVASMADIVGKSLFDFIRQDFRDMSRERVKSLLKEQTNPPPLNVKAVTLKGNEVDVEVHSIQVRYNETPAVLSAFSDVTEKKKAEAKLREEEENYRKLYKTSKRQEELYRSLLNSSADAIVIYNLVGEVQYISPSFTKIFGWTFEEMKGKKIPFVPDSEREPSMAVIVDLIENSTQVHGFETRRLTKDGRVLDISISASRYSDYAGTPEGMLVILRDVTEKKLAEQKLVEEEKRYRGLYSESKRQEELYRSLLRSSADTIIIYNLEGDTEFVSSSFTKTFGWTFEEVKGKQIPFIPEIEKEATAAISRELRLKRESFHNFETKRLTKDGRALDVSASGSLFYDAEGEPAGILVVLRDITERAKAEAAIRKSEKRFRELYDSISDLIMTLTLEGRFLSANKAVYDVIGYTPEEFIGSLPSRFMKLEIRDLFDSEFLASVRKYGFHNGISSYLTKDGRKIYVEHRSALVKPEDGAPYISAIGRDVTERVLAEKRIKKLQEEMLQSQKMEAIGTLAGGIAHDFNNLLMGIQGNVSLLEIHTNAEDPGYERLKNIEEYVQSGSELTRQLLGFARGGRYEVVSTDLNKLIDKEIQLFGRAKKEIEIHKKFQHGLWAVEVDQGQMGQVFLNLFVNAWQAMPMGGRLYLQTENVVFKENAPDSLSLPPGRYVKATVSDTGTGMDEATQKRIFEPFFTTKEKGRGTGLGLASVYGIIKNHGGIIDVVSREGIGTTFTLYFPATGKKTRKEKQGFEEKIVSGKERILLVDDEEKILDIGKQLLGVLGYEVVPAENGKKAIELFREDKNAFNLIILDMVMPDMGGRETFAALREISPDIKVLLASGYSIDGEASEIMAQGCNGFIQKPFSMKKLSSKIREVLAGS